MERVSRGGHYFSSLLRAAFCRCCFLDDSGGKAVEMKMNEALLSMDANVKETIQVEI